MTIALGVDTLCWHWRLESGLISIDELLADAAGLGAECVQLGLFHVRACNEAELTDLERRAGDLGLSLLASGDAIGSAVAGNTVADGVERVARWLERARALGSASVRLTSGFYRAELAGDPQAVERERRHVVEVLSESVDRSRALGIRILLENHSDFTADEYVSIIEAVGQEDVGVFLDPINPISAFEDPRPVVSRLLSLAPAGHIKDFRLRSLQMPDGHHRRGFEVRWVYPGEGVAPLDELVRRLVHGLDGRDYALSVEGLDNSEAADQLDRLGPSLQLLRTLIAESAASPMYAVGDGPGRPVL